MAKIYPYSPGYGDNDWHNVRKQARERARQQWELYGADGIKAIEEERRGHFDREGWTAEHDATYIDGELLRAALVYIESALPDDQQGCVDADQVWPWDKSWDKRHKHDLLKRLRVAGSLVAAEISRVRATTVKETP